MNNNNSFDPQSNSHSEEIDQETLLKLQKLKPSTKADPKFASMLRQELSDHAQAVSPLLETPSKQPLRIFNYMNKLIMPLIAVAVIASGAGYWYATNDGNSLIGIESANQLLSDKYEVAELDENSFGDLNKVKIVANGRGSSLNGSGGGNNNSAMAESDKMAAPGYGGGGDSSIMPVPDVYTKFEYTGEKITNLPKEQGVLKRLKPEQSSGVVAKIIRIFSFGLINLDKMENTKVQNVAFIEDKEYGLGVNVDLNYGSINMYQNWEKWPQPQYNCYGYQCGPEPRLKPSDIPSDEDAIKIADQFIADYSISKEGYGSGQVLDYSNWRILYEQAPDKDSVYLPEMIQVLYPLRLGGQAVYDEGGSPSGMSVQIDVRTKKASGLYGLETKQFEKSSYLGETDVDRIMEIALRGGYRNYPYYDGVNQTLQLGTPKVQLVRMWYTQDINKQGEELYVPALVFPITTKTEPGYWRKNVIVPLVKDILDNENIYGNPTPMPVDSNIPSDNPNPPVGTEPAIVEETVVN